MGTSEVPLAAFHLGEILEEADLPIRYAGYSTCFRREAGSYGKDIGRMFRVHQFDKVEMFVVLPRPRPVLGRARADPRRVEEEIIGNLEIPYRVVNIAAGDLGGPAAKKYDIEGWLPARGATASSRRARTPPTTRRDGCRRGCGAAEATSRCSTR